MTATTNTELAMSTSAPTRARKPTVEWALPDENDPLRQCDLLVNDKPGLGEQPEFLLVVTADCDLAQSKHQGYVLVVPVFEIDEYLIKFRLPSSKEIRTLQGLLRHEIVNEVSKALAAAGKPISDSSIIREWYLQDGIDVIVQMVSGYEPSSYEDVMTACAQAKKLALLDRSWAAAISLREYHNEMKNIMMSIPEPGQKLKQPDTILNEAIRNFVGPNTPKDVYLLSELSPLLKAGYVVGLRFPRTIRFSDVSLLPNDLENRYRRISSIIPPYSFSIANQFGGLFTAVGLPDEQRDSIKLMGEMRVATYSERANI